MASPPILSKIADTIKPDASSTAMYLPPGRMFAILSIWERVSERRSLILDWSLLHQYSQTLNNVGSTVVKYFEYLKKWVSISLLWLRVTYFASLRFLYFSLLYSVFSE